MLLRNTLTKFIFLLSIASCRQDTVEECGPNTDCKETLACGGGLTCPIGSSCVEDFCELEQIAPDVVQTCDSENPCGRSDHECVEGTCQYVNNGTSCTTENALEMCGELGYCSFTIEQNCGLEAVGGLCTDGLVDENFGVLAPVCGCDGNTYWNSQISAMNQINISSDGLCGNPDEAIPNF